MSLDQLDQALSGGGAPSAFNADTPIGTSVTGKVISAEVRQLTDYVTGKPKTWDDGRPQMQVIITLQTEDRDPAISDDTGERRVFIKTWGVWKEALNAAIKAAGGTKASDVLVPGAKFTATFTGTKPSSMGSPMKVYEYEIQPAAAAGVDQALDTPAPAAAPASAPDAQPAASGAGNADQVKQLIAVGLGDEQIAAATGLDLTTVQAIRNVAA